MRRFEPIFIFAISVIATLAHAGTPTTPAQILAVMTRMADAQLAQKPYSTDSPSDWVAGSFYIGLMRLAETSHDPDIYAALGDIAEDNGWELHINDGTASTVHADNQAIGQMYLRLAEHAGDLSLIDAFQDQLNRTILWFSNPKKLASFGGDLKRDGSPLPWWWADSLFMAPAGLAEMSRITGDPTYLDAMDRQFWKTTARLYDTREHLFYRDSRYLTAKSPNGQKVFWSRGNGWVLAGLTNILDAMPDNDSRRQRYEKLFIDTAYRLLKLQQADGLWRMSLLDPKATPGAETSGSAFYCYALAWGINNGLLGSSHYRPAVDQAWTALNQHVLSNGLIGAVQPINDKPDPTKDFTNSSQPYAVGAFLLAGCERIKLIQ